LEDYYYSKKITPSVKALKRKHFNKDVVFHRYKIQNRKNDFAVLKTQQGVDEFIIKFSHYVANIDFKIILSAINKADYYKTYGTKRDDLYLPEDIYSIVFTFAIERFVLFLRDNGSEGRIIAESRGKKEDQSIQYWYSLILHNGTQFIRDWQFREVLPNAIEFKEKEENVIGLQIADWIANPMSKMIQYLDGSKDRYGEWDIYKNKIWLGKNAPARGHVGFKVFPKNLGRKLLNMPLKSS